MRTFAAFCLFLSVSLAQTPETVRVVSKTLDRQIHLPGEFTPFESVVLYARVSGFVERVLVDRGSVVKKGQLLAELRAPEMKAQIAESQSKAQTAIAQQAEASARLASAQNSLDRLTAANKTPGAVAQNEIVLAEQALQAARAQVAAAASSTKAAQAAVEAMQELDSYLQVTAPFDGVVTERLAHPGALAGPAGAPLLRIEEQAKLRLVVAVPEAEAGSIGKGQVAFTVPAYPGQTFQATVARLSHTVDPKTRTMPVELDVANPRGLLAPGMYPDVAWPVRRSHASLLVPATAVVTTTERTFVIRATSGIAEWVDVKKGLVMGDLVEVLGSLSDADIVVKRATDEIRPGAKLR